MSDQIDYKDLMQKIENEAKTNDLSAFCGTPEVPFIFLLRRNDIMEYLVYTVQDLFYLTGWKPAVEYHAGFHTLIFVRDASNKLRQVLFPIRPLERIAYPPEQIDEDVSLTFLYETRNLLKRMKVPYHTMQDRWGILLKPATPIFALEVIAQIVPYLGLSDVTVNKEKLTISWKTIKGGNQTIFLKR